MRLLCWSSWDFRLFCQLPCHTRNHRYISRNIWYSRNSILAPDICAEFEATSLPASPPNHILRGPVSPPAAAQRDAEYDDIFRCDPSQADFTKPLQVPGDEVSEER
jgi:hypothetical protein